MTQLLGSSFSALIPIGKFPPLGYLKMLLMVPRLERTNDSAKGAHCRAGLCVQVTREKLPLWLSH